MKTQTVVIIVGVAALAAGAFWAYKKHPEWFRASTPQNPNQVNPAVVTNSRDATAQRIEAGANAFSSVTGALGSFLE